MRGDFARNQHFIQGQLIRFQFEEFLESYPPVDENEEEVFEQAQEIVTQNNEWLNTNRFDFEDWFDEH